MRSVVTEMGGLDIVLDDGSHRVSHQRASFEVLFPLLSQNGLYVVEDLHSNYSRGECEGGWRRRSTFLEQMKDLIDDLHGWWHKRPQRLVGAHQIIEGIHFYDSIVVIEKSQSFHPPCHPWASHHSDWFVSGNRCFSRYFNGRSYTARPKTEGL